MVVIAITISTFSINALELETMTSFEELRDTNAGQSLCAVGVFEIRLHPSGECDMRIGWRAETSHAC